MTPAESTSSSYRQTPQQFEAIALEIELTTYARIFPWTCLAVFLLTGIPSLLFESASSLYSERLIWGNRFTAALAAGAGLWTTFRPASTPVLAGRLAVKLGAVLLAFVAFCNALLLVDTGDTRHAGAAVVTMVCAAVLYPRFYGVLLVSAPQFAIVVWLGSKAQWPAEWFFALFWTMGAASFSLLGFYARSIWFRRHHALLAERAAMVEELHQDSLERTVLQERILNQRHLSTLGRLAGGIAHDLNNILVPILGNAAMLEESVQTSTHQRQAREVMRAAGRARSLTQQLSYFSDRGSAELEMLELNQTLSELAPIVWRAFPQGVDIKLELPDHSLHLHTNRRELQDLVTNLLLDAGNATPAGSTVVLGVVERAPIPEGFAAQPEREYCAITISDSADQLTPLQRSRMLAADASAGFSRETGKPETLRGLGLLGAKTSAEQLGGYMDIDVAEDGGNLFCLFLPRKLQTEETRPEANPKLSAGVATEVLVADDEPAVRSVTVQLLERAGFIVRACDSGEAALEEIASHLPDIVVMDLRMPGIGGRVATETIRRQNSQLPIVICTGFTGDADGWLAGLPNCALLQKPYETQELLSTVRELVQRAELAAD